MQHVGCEDEVFAICPTMGLPQLILAETPKVMMVCGEPTGAANWWDER